MKIAIGIWLAIIPCIFAADLDFTEIRKEMRAPVEAKVVAADFEFTNRTDKPVSIKKYDGACSCMAVKIKDGKLLYAPGESGLVRAEFDMGNFSGEVDKTVTLWLDGDPEDKPSVVLTVHVIIPVLVLTDPKTLKWEIDGKPEPQTIQIKMHHTKPIKVLSVTSSSEAYAHEIKTIEEGKSYELIVTPLDLKTPGLAILRILTDCEIGKFKTQQVFAQVRRPTAAAIPAKP